MKLLLFSRRGVVHAADELRRTFAAIARYGFDFVVNKEFAETIRSLGVAQIPAEKEYGCNACPPVGAISSTHFISYPLLAFLHKRKSFQNVLLRLPFCPYDVAHKLIRIS